MSALMMAELQRKRPWTIDDDEEAPLPAPVLTIGQPRGVS